MSGLTVREDIGDNRCKSMISAFCLRQVQPPWDALSLRAYISTL